MTGIILNSGGMDSFFVALEYPELPHVFVDIGHKYAAKERDSARRIADLFGVPLHEMQGAHIGQYEHSSGIIPLRNAELILCAGQHGSDIYMGILENEVNSDKSPEFLRAMETVMTISCRPQYWSKGRRFHIHTPLGTRSKAMLVADLWDAVGRNANADLWRGVLATVSCYDGGDRHCGTCPSCFKRWVALTVATGVDHGKLFVRHPCDVKGLTHWEAQGYPASRINEIRQAYGVRYGV